MNIVQQPVIKETNDINSKQGLLISPNIFFINKEIIKKGKGYKRLIVWFDIKSNGIKLDLKQIKPIITLKDFKFQLVLNNKGNSQPLLIDKKDIVNINELKIEHDKNGKRIENDCFLTYEIESKLLNDNNNFLYTLEYKNSDSIGLTQDNRYGKNKGNIFINVNQKKYEFENIVSYLNNDTYKNKKDISEIVDQDKIVIDKQQVNKLQNKNKPLLKIKTEKNVNVYSSALSFVFLKTKLNEINQQYLDNKLHIKNESFINANNNGEIKIKQGNGFNFQNNKFDLDNNDVYLKDDKIIINFEYDTHSFSVDLNVSENKEQISTKRFEDIRKDSYITYSMIRQNTKFNDFVVYRNNNLNETSTN